MIMAKFTIQILLIFCQVTAEANQISPDINQAEVYDWELLNEDNCR